MKTSVIRDFMGVLPLMLFLCLTVTVFGGPDLRIQIISHVTSCTIPNGKVIATADGKVSGYTFTWYCGLGVEGASCFSGSEVSGLNFGNYTVVAKDETTEEISDPVYFSINDERLLPDPTITQAGNVLYFNSGSGSSFEWYFNGQPIAETDAEISPTESGDYQIKVTSDLGCVGFSDVFIFSLTGVQHQESLAACALYPNPAKEHITIPCCGGSFVTIWIYDARGVEIVKQQVRCFGPEDPIDISRLPNGTFFFTIVDSQQMRVKGKFVKAMY